MFDLVTYWWKRAKAYEDILRKIADDKGICTDECYVAMKEKARTGLQRDV